MATTVRNVDDAATATATAAAAAAAIVETAAAGAEVGEKKLGKRPATDAVCDASPPKDVANPTRWQMELARRAGQSVVVSEMPVTCYREIWGAPKKRVSYLCRVQTPPSEALHQEWPLKDGGLWGYVFNYNSNEACFYQLVKGERYSPAGLKATLTSGDWSVLTVLGSSALVREQPKSGFTEAELWGEQKKSESKRLVSSMVWETKSTGSGRWYFRASHQTATDGDDAAETTDEFVLEYFNQDCGVFQTTLRVPLDDWIKVMQENGEKLRALYLSCQSYRDIMLVKKAL